MTGPVRRLLHLSDLHFGRTRPELLEPLLASVNACAADLVVVSGDFTQRARRSQFAEARAFLDRIAAPTLVVPGNHDVPLDNVWLRMTRPFEGYRRWISSDLEPSYSDAAMIVQGVNTVDPFSWQRGRIPRRAVARACEAFRNGPHRRIRVLVAHHPLQHDPAKDKAPMRGAGRAFDAFATCGADILLTGHLHCWGAEPFAARRGEGGAILQIQAGTGLSTRLRGESNDFNLLTIGPGRVAVERHVATDGAGFAPAVRVAFERGERGWTPRSDAPEPRDAPER